MADVVFAKTYMPPSLRHFLIILNPLANGNANRYLRTLLSALQQLGDTYDIWQTTANEQANLRHLQQCREQYTDWVVLGGDGTLNLVVNVLAHSDIPLGLIPCGSGNDFARNLYAGQDDPVAVVVGEYCKKVDLGLCNERYFANVLGVGFDGAVVASLYNDQPRRFRRWRYLQAALIKLFTYPEQELHLTSSKIKREPAFIAAFANGRYFGGGMQIAPQAHLDDNMLDCVWVGHTSLPKKLYYLSRIFSGSHIRASAVDYWQDSAFEIHTAGLPIEGDGEFFGVTPAQVCVVPGALCLKVPCVGDRVNTDPVCQD
ncbi:diacylglycerol/lipid kinase family protein [Bowmanella denitrificans]|uniref:diacylglycerol/lipid kinase family protein n=1 Tax=Bowmanella denitrificans TaxID=366582 RepID=UPI000C9CEDEE|nr:diacylglycerol kinase family protein [Bowmanella denitrificans]